MWEAALIESHIPGQSLRVSTLIPELIALGVSLVPNKRDLNGLGVKFAPLVSGYMHIPLASEDAQV